MRMQVPSRRPECRVRGNACIQGLLDQSGKANGGKSVHTHHPDCTHSHLSHTHTLAFPLNHLVALGLSMVTMASDESVYALIPRPQEVPRKPSMHKSSVSVAR